MILIIGSHALNHHITNLEPMWALRQPKDKDVIATYDDAITFLKEAGAKRIEPLQGGSKLHGIIPLYKTADGKQHVQHVEIELAWPDSTAEALLKAVWGRSDRSPSTPTIERRVAPLDALYALKMSHRYKKNSPHFIKTMRDIQAMRALGASIGEDLAEWFKTRQRETYAYKHPKLNTTRSNFFADDGINYVHDHDSIHDAIKLLDKPAFDYFKPDSAEVFCDKNMFLACDPHVRVYAVYEESCVLALERSIVPHAGVLTPESAFAKALEKVCTSITSGWFREFAWENYDAVMALYAEQTEKGENYVEVFNKGLKAGIVKPYSK